MTPTWGQIPLERVNQMPLDPSLRVNPFQRKNQAFEQEWHPDQSSGCMFGKF